MRQKESNERGEGGISDYPGEQLFRVCKLLSRKQGVQILCNCCFGGPGRAGWWLTLMSSLVNMMCIGNIFFSTLQSVGRISVSRVLALT